MMDNSCAALAFSDEYRDYIASFSATEESIRQRYGAQCVLNIQNRYLVAYISENEQGIDRTSASIAIPRLFVTLDSGAAQSTGVLRVRNSPYLGMEGTGVIVGIIDTGID